LPQRREGGLPLLLVGTRDGASSLPGRIAPHATQAFLSFGEQRIVELSAGFQVGTQAFGLPFVDDQRQLEQKGRGLLALLAGLLPGSGMLRALWVLPCHPSAFLIEERLF
jgi:hypothetical protein